MIKHFLYLLLLITLSNVSANALNRHGDIKTFNADDPLIQYTGRISLKNPHIPRIWASGVYVEAKFKGSKCEVLINDEVPGDNHNYLEIVIDGKNPYRIKLKDKINVISIPDGLSDGEHTILICKDTESNTGYIDIVGFRCEQLLPLSAKPKRKIEYFGDSITSGTGMDLSVIACDKGQWYDQHNGYMSYGARTSRNLNAQWQLTAQAGVGLIHSCCNMEVVMPQIYDKVFLRSDSIKWDFKTYRPDVVTICLGQNDGPQQDSTQFCTAYINFIKTIRQHYPKADIICLTSPMGDKTLSIVLQRYLTAITNNLNAAGDKRVSKYFFSRQYHNGCGGHPDLADHELIANELTAYIKQLKGW
ncbi:GDSL-like lipase/acylhydrolase family protein [Mucilaginibacter frigoritolerans]|uniref:GDSL-like lipase/acylhydrolase family protein n=1 Tax=Mucilaginibacter frigoritolerans TaxID=652788 RepID=A0A562U0I0_9SPHI|nr:SGNH/GDSL hydrolase family protein [Mucilaginibacter frigoritolerans]TWI99371.1 GDSL-like lipase/acylhydrolase family protein [Mucilaginibacter frigoritolerans]